MLATTMTVSEQAPYVVVSYVVTLGGIAVYAWRLLARARKMGSQVRDEDRPWT